MVSIAQPAFTCGVIPEVATGGFLLKKVFLEISQNSLKNTCARVSFLIESLWHRCFPGNFVKFLRTSFYIEHRWWLLLNFMKLSGENNLFHKTNFSDTLNKERGSLT